MLISVFSWFLHSGFGFRILSAFGLRISGFESATKLCRVLTCRLGFIASIRSKLALPSGHHGGGEAVANEIDGCAGHVQELVDSDDQNDAFDGQVKGSVGQSRLAGRNPAFVRKRAVHAIRRQSGSELILILEFLF